VRKSGGYLQKHKKGGRTLLSTVLIHSFAFAARNVDAAGAPRPRTPRLRSIHAVAESDQQEVIAEMLVRDVASGR
jgi:hypothetical protein